MGRHLDTGGWRLTSASLPARWRAAAGVTPVLAVLMFIVWPVVTLAVRVADNAAIGDVLGATRTRDVALFTLVQATISTAVTVTLGIAPALVIARYRFRGRRAVLAALTALFVMPTVVLAAGIRTLLPRGLDEGLWAIVAAHTVFNLAVVVRTVGAVTPPVDREAAARTLGAAPLTVLRTVTWPHIRPAVIAAASIVFLFDATSYGVVRVLGDISTSTIEVEIWREAVQLGRVDSAVILSLAQMVVLGIVVVTTNALARRRPTTATATMRTARPGFVGRIIIGATAALIAAPFIALVIGSVRTADGFTMSAWTSMFDDEIRPGLRLGIDPLGAATTTITTAAIATAIAMLIGVLAVVAVVGSSRVGALIDTALMAPLALSAVTIGLGLIITFDQSPIDWRASWFMLPLGQALVALPFVVRATIGAARSVGADRQAAAATLGAGPVRAWATAVIPALRRPLLAAAGLAAAVSIGEFGATSLLSRTGRETLPIVIERLLARTGGDFVARGHALSVVLAMITVLLVAGIDRGGDDALT